MARGRRRSPSLRTRLVLAAAYLIIVILVALEWPLARLVQTQNLNKIQSSSIGFAGLLASRISEPVAAANADPGTPQPSSALTAAVDATLVAYERLDLPQPRIIVTDSHLRVLIDSQGEFAPGTTLDAAGRPEFTAALSGSVSADRRRSVTLGTDLMIVAVPVFEGSQVVGAVRLSQPLTEVNRTIHRSWLGLALVGLAVLAVGLTVAWALAGWIARPVERLDQAALRLGGGDLSARVPEEGPGEVATLAHSFNRMADAVSANVDAQRDFVANASHQLRTPLTGLRLRLETIQDGGGPQAEQAAQAEVEVDRLASLVEDLLALARASATGEARPEPVDLADAARSAIDRWTDAVGRSGKSIASVAGPRAVVLAAPADIEHILDNLIENAIRYAPAGAEITVETTGGPTRSTVSVADTGPGIPAEDRERLFERFYRGSTGRAAGAGTGLGLAIVAGLAERWGGSARLQDGAGTRIEVSFPAGGPTVP